MTRLPHIMNLTMNLARKIVENTAQFLILAPQKELEERKTYTQQKQLSQQQADVPEEIRKTVKRDK